MDISKDDRHHIIRDKYDGDTQVDVSDDAERLEAGEPLAYVIGWVPFLGLHINLDSRPLIPRPETEWWTELLIADVKQRFANKPFTVLDLCAGSGAIGLAVLKECAHATVYFGEISEAHCELIAKNIQVNGLDASRAIVRSGDLFAPFMGIHFDVIATNPPYVPSERKLDQSVTAFEPAEALYAGTDGLALIRRIAADAPAHLSENGALWLECDTSHTTETADLLQAGGAKQTDIRTDLYGRERLVLAYY